MGEHYNHKKIRKAKTAQRGCVIWFTGLPGSGKSTLANGLEKRLNETHLHSYILDGDIVRQGLNNDLGFSPRDRAENIRRIGEVCKLFIDAGVFVLAAFISPYHAHRDMVRKLFREADFIEIYVKCPVLECERRDPKGLYRKARVGQLENFTGITAPYEEPLNPEIIIETNILSLNDAIDLIIENLIKMGFLYYNTSL
ncbi:adenylyl-sulfate kinase [Candidatus Desulfosporosinus infrequens]|uniref:Adenylyl-sulfate kinase n=1 Tax=Candidatus Desulfosporosinus infrequens TaxID=2043169 RepID=A0A2U3KY26_9FIRM|nr:adenylyl-sulfate kinase [Candidatus Desulfosporosinus infrequens]